MPPHPIQFPLFHPTLPRTNLFYTLYVVTWHSTFSFTVLSHPTLPHPFLSHPPSTLLTYALFSVFWSQKIFTRWGRNVLMFFMWRALNTLSTGDADLRFYITTVQDGWRKSTFLTRACFPCTIHLIMQYIEPVSEWSCWRMFIETWTHSVLTFRHRASSI